MAARAADPTRDVRRVEVLLLILAGGIALQVVPLPAPIVDGLSPADRPTWQRLALRVPSALPLTIDPGSTVWAGVVAAMAIVTFVTARRLLHSGGIRMFIRGISAIGLLLSAIGLAQDVSGRGLMYWSRAPLQEGAPPFGPFVDRNSFATWVLLAIPLCGGYLVAHTAVHHRPSVSGVRWRARVREMLDARAIWLMASISLMLIALAATLSRSGMISLGAAVLLGAYLHGRRRPRISRGSSWVAAACAVGIVLAVARIDPFVLGRRFAAARTSAADRFTIWRETIPIVHDFWLTGTGAGTYETAMLVYQRSSPGVRFNQAHNHYLQVVAEGGLLLSVPLALALLAWLRAAARKLRADGSGMYWIRAGAFCGLAGVAAQSLWDTGLTAPANALLAAVAAAIVVHHHETRPESQH
jgi:O-antigen ligase